MDSVHAWDNKNDTQLSKALQSTINMGRRLNYNMHVLHLFFFLVISMTDLSNVYILRCLCHTNANKS